MSDGRTIDWSGLPIVAAALGIAAVDMPDIVHRLLVIRTHRARPAQD